MKHGKTDLQSPWVSFANEVKELFRQDPNIKITWDDDTLELNLYVTGIKKVEALNQLLPSEKTFGNVTMYINVIPADLKDDIKDNRPNYIQLLNDAFEGNPLFKETWVYDDGYISNPVMYCIMAKEVSQYYNDNLHDAHGNRTCLPEDLAKEVLLTKHINYCTDNK